MLSSAFLLRRARHLQLATRRAVFPSQCFSSQASAVYQPYDFEAVERKWQDVVRRSPPQAQNTLRNPAGSDLEKYYVLSMFPYPSGALHLGHVRVYTLSDCIARVQRMRGFDVLHPMGWDSFGLPAENAAIEREVSPAAWTDQNIAQMRAQLDSLGFSFDWDRSVTTSSPEYYKWTQWLFIKMYEAGLVYRKEAVVNWDPIDCTVLANEQVAADGTSWRSGAVVEERLLPQWFIKTTAFADELEGGLETLAETWPAKVRTMQQQWIGRSPGVRVAFEVETEVTSDDGEADDITVFTTRADTLMGVTFLAVAPTHALAKKLGRPVEEGESVQVPGVVAKHPLTGEKVPVFVADYVVGDYADGAVMGVPAHDARDHAFALRNDLPIKTVVKDPSGDTADGELCEAPGVVVNSGAGFDGLQTKDACDAIANALMDCGRGGPALQFKLRDWLVSRQRYWGAPIPMIHCTDCGVVPVPEEDLPVRLPELQEEHFASLRGDSAVNNSNQDISQGTGLLASDAFTEWRGVKCPKCGGHHARRETDTLDTFVDSSWYYLRYCGGGSDGSPGTQGLPHDVPFSSEALRKWMPVDVYIGGIEHAILHLLYARLVGHFMNGGSSSSSLGPIAPPVGDLESPEPFSELLAQGMVRGRTHKDPTTGRYLKPEEVSFDDKGKGIITASGVETMEVWEKMSKSKYNGIDPAAVVSEFGADATRLAMLFKAPVPKDLEWDAAALKSQQRFLNRIWRVKDAVLDNLAGDKDRVTSTSAWIDETLPRTDTNSAQPSHDFDSWLLSDEARQTTTAAAAVKLVQTTHGAISKVTDGVVRDRSFNVAISELMVLTNAIEATVGEDNTSVETNIAAALSLRGLLLMIAPFAPHCAAEMWSDMQAHAGASTVLSRLQGAPSSSWSGEILPDDDSISIHDQPWPTALDEYLQGTTDEGKVNLSVSVMGKFRGMLEVAGVEGDAPEEADVVAAVMESDLSKWLEGQTVTRTIVKPTPDKCIVNFVLAGGAKKKKGNKKKK